MQEAGIHMYVFCPTATSSATASESKASAIFPKHEALSDMTNFESKRKAGLCIYVHVTYCIMGNWHERIQSICDFIFC